MARIPSRSQRRRPRPATLAAVLGLLLATTSDPLGAQEPTLPAALQPRVRISSPRGSAVTGNLLGLAGDSLVLRRARDAAPLVLPLASVGRIEVSEGRHARTGRGALIGFLSGAALGTGLLVAAASADDSGMNDGVVEFAAFVVGSGMALAGVGIGALVGSAIHTERWREVPLHELRAGVGRNGGVAISLRLGLPRPLLTDASSHMLHATATSPRLIVPAATPRSSCASRGRATAWRRSGERD